ncbi:MAG: IS200/IS605 family transposase [Prolixibacteraceae bacterium]|nr:IS200/IS605 family transposase [Prolixibacteraceae bacterium]
MSYVRIWIHAVWGTKSKFPFLTDEIRAEVFQHISGNANTKGIFIKEINGHKNHVHCLISLSADQSVAKVMQLIKGESSFWINNTKLVKGKFEWADEYFAVSLGESQVEKVQQYIRNQKEHHKRKTWDEEVDEFLEKYQFARIADE